MNLLIEWAKKSPPEMIPYIMHMAMELSQLPNKELLLSKLEPLIGIQPGEEDMSDEDRKAKVVQELETHAAQAQKQAAFTEKLQGYALEKARLENDLLQAQIEAVRTGAKVDVMKVRVASDKVNTEGF
jgi:hypothetical protein